jgi:putative membrane protein
MKKVCLIISLVVFAGLIYAQTTQDSFMSKAMEMSQANINLGRMAQEKAEDQKVKDFAETDVQDHTQALQKMREGQGESESEPALTKEHQQMSDQLSRLSGAEFDKAYMDAMVRDHQQAIQTFQQAANTGTGNARQKPGTDTKSDADIAREMLPTLQQHLNQAEQIDKSVGGSATIK